MILKIQFDAYSPAASQYPDLRLAFLRMDPDIPAQFRRSRGQCGHCKLIEAKFFGNFPDLLAHSDDVGFLIDAKFPCLAVVGIIAGKRNHCRQLAYSASVGLE